MPTFQQLVDQAETEVECLEVSDVVALLTDPSVTLVDVRDVREIWREGRIPRSYHMSRGMTEFWVDQTSPYCKSIFAEEGRKFVFYCNKGWRSALAAKAAKDVGLANSSHMRGGFTAWVETGAPTETVEKK